MFLKLPLNHHTINRTWTYIRHCSLVVIKETNKAHDALQPAQQDLDLSEITPNFRQSFNIASYVNRSETLQNLVNLNVNLSKIEKKPNIVEKFLRLDFEKDIKNHIIFFNNYVNMEQIGDYITKNPMILYEDIDDLKVRINYLTSKGFEESQIKRIISNNPYWLMFSTVRIDRRLGYFQECFELTGKEVRYLATRQPKLITYNLHLIKTNLFTLKEEKGFENNEIKGMLLDKPKILMLSHSALLERMNYIHNVMRLSHRTIANNPELLLSRVYRIKQRHLFLEKLGRAQYDPKKENYIPVTALIKDTDLEFCKNFAKCNVGDFNMFLKTL